MDTIDCAAVSEILCRRAMPYTCDEIRHIQDAPDVRIHEVIAAVGESFPLLDFIRDNGCDENFRFYLCADGMLITLLADLEYSPFVLAMIYKQSTVSIDVFREQIIEYGEANNENPYLFLAEFLRIIEDDGLNNYLDNTPPFEIDPD